MIKCIVLTTDKEPEVICISGSRSSILAEIQKKLSKEELDLGVPNDIESFRPTNIVENIVGYVEEYSACHPYKRNRGWHGPAILLELDYDGDYISMKDETIEQLKEIFSLENSVLKSPSKYINKFLKDNFKPQIHNAYHKQHTGVLNTADAVDVILSQTEESAIKIIEGVFKEMSVISMTEDVCIKELLDDYLKYINKNMFIEQVESVGF